MKTQAKAILAAFVVLAVLVTLPPRAAHAEITPIRPCRIYDSRTGGAAALTAGVEYTIGVRDLCGVPFSANAVTYNATIVAPSSNGYVTIYPADEDPPTVSSLNFRASEVRGNGGFVGLAKPAPGDELSFRISTSPAGGTAHLVIDVTGYQAGSLAAVMAAAVHPETRPERWTTVDEGSVIDNATGLQWEQKTDDGTAHDKDFKFTLTTTFGDDGTAYTDFLAALNSEPCYAGHCDWRLPTVEELRTLIDYTTPGCINGTGACTSFPGPTLLDDGVVVVEYPTVSRVPGFTDHLTVEFGTPSVYPKPPSNSFPVRAVRGGRVAAYAQS